MKFARLLLLFSLFCPRVQADEPSLMQNQIKYVVVLMLENRSFDNVLGWLYENNEQAITFNPPDRNEPFYGLSDDTLAQYTNVAKDSNGNIILSSPPIKGVPSCGGTAYLNSPSYDPNEAFLHVTQQIYSQPGSADMLGFLQDFASQWSESDWVDSQKDILSCLETYTENELPNFYGLASHYAVSDEWFSSVPTQTNPNRAFAACCTSEGQVLNGWWFEESSFHCNTIWNQLSQVSPDTSWKIFWQADMLPFIISGPFTGPNNFKSMELIPELESHYDKIDSFHTLARTGQLPAFSFIEPQLTSLANIAQGLTWIDKSLIPPFIIGWQGNDMHPPADVRTVENLLANIYTSLIANTDSWNQTLLVITFDEHGGIFDHVPPPPAIPPDQDDGYGFNFTRYGVRVPTIFISPLIQQSSVLRSNIPNTPFDHTSLNATLLSWLNIDKSLWNMGARCAVAPTFDTVITSTTPRTDTIIAPSDAVLPPVDPANVVQMGDPFYLSDPFGNYITESRFFFEEQARIGSSDNKLALTFSGGQGPITSGSFAFIASSADNSLLTTSMTNWDCTFTDNLRGSEQWWTIKSMDVPYLAAPIQYGDRLYIENHTYMNICQLVPARLWSEWGLFGSKLVTKGIIDNESPNYYWIIEKAQP